MGDLDIWNPAKQLVLNQYLTQPDNVDIFSMRKIKPVGFIRHKMILESNASSLNPTFRYSAIRDQSNEYFVGNMMMVFTSPDISGANEANFTDYLGYAVIERVTIKIGQKSHTFEGDYFLNHAMALSNKDKILHDAGHNDLLRKVNKGSDDSQKIKHPQIIKVLLPLPFGFNFPKNLLCLSPNDEIGVDIAMRPPISVICHSTKTKIDTGAYTKYQLHIEVYTKKRSNRISYIPMIDIPLKFIIPSADARSCGITKNMTTDLIKLPGCRRFDIRVDTGLNGKEYPMLFSAWKDEYDVVNQFVDYIIDNILIIIPADMPLEKLTSQYPSSAVFVEVIDSKVVINHPGNVNQKRIIDVSISRIPSPLKLMYHTNFLTINKYMNIVLDKVTPIDDPWKQGLNISEKLSSVQGYYDSGRSKIITTKVNHSFVSQHASIPLDVYRTYGEDNRKTNSNNYIIWNYFTNGTNMFSRSTIDNFVLYYDNDSFNNDSIIINNTISDNLNLFDEAPSINLSVSINFDHNISRFNFDNQSEFKMYMSIRRNIFDIIKIEYLKVSRDVTEFKEANHIESNFDTLMPVSYIIITYSSHNIDQVRSTSDNNLQPKVETNISLS